MYEMRLQRIDVGKKRGQQLVVGKLLKHLALGKEHADPIAARNANVCLTRLAGAVHRAAHDGHGDGLCHGFQTLLHRLGQGDEVDLRPPAGGAGHQVRPLFPQAMATAFTRSSPPMLPGLMRILAAPFSAARMARR